MSKVSPYFWLFLCVVTLCVAGLLALRILLPHDDKRVTFIDSDHVHVEFLYGDCWVTERYKAQERTFRPLYPATSSEKAERRWRAEFGSDPKVIRHEEEVPPGAHILLDEAKPVLPEAFNGINSELGN